MDTTHVELNIILLNAAIKRQVYMNKVQKSRNVPEKEQISYESHLETIIESKNIMKDLLADYRIARQRNADFESLFLRQEEEIKKMRAENEALKELL